MEHFKPLLHHLPLLPPAGHKFLVLTCWVKCLTSQVFPRLVDLEMNPGVCSSLISMSLFTCTPSLPKAELTARAAPEGKQGVKSGLKVQGVETGTSRAGSALAALVLDNLYT